jgi:putative phage-type endonuclease
MPIRVNLKQGTQEWLNWRMEGIGSSDVPAILGVSPWKTYQELVMQKAHRMAGGPPNAAMRRGSELEPKIRELYQRQSYLYLPDAAFEHSEYRFMRASLDGFNDENNVAFEAKAPNKYDHFSAVNGEVPEKYIPQCQHILLVSEADQLHYVSHWNNENAVVLVKPDPDYHQMLIEKESEFWEKVLKLRKLSA